MKIVTFLVAAVLCSSVFALKPEDCTFYAPFDGAFDAAQARGSGKATVKGEIRFVPGIRGQGILVGAPETGLTYATQGNLDLDAGSVSVWVKPETWDDTDAAMRFFFAVNAADTKSPADGGTFLWLYRFFSQSTYFLVWDSRGYPTLVSGDAKFAKGTWVHLVGAWSGDELRFYINGKFQGASRVGTPRILRSIASTFTVGDPNRANAADTVLDELRIFDRPLTEPEVEALYKSELQAAPTQQSVTVVVLSGARKVRVDVNALARKPNETTGLSALVRLLPKEGDTAIAETTVARFDACHATVEFSTADLAPGAYRIVSVLKDNGADLATTEAAFAVNAPPAWLGSKVGVTAAVPAPWVPVTVEKEDTAALIECLGPRRFHVGGTLLPTQFFTAGQQILAAPIALRGIVNGTPLAPAAVQTTWGQASPARVEFAASGSSGNVKVSTSSLVEYDGLLWTTLTLASETPLKVANLAVEMALKKDLAILMFTSFGYESAGAVRPWKHRLAAGGQVWLGNEDGGLQCTIPSACNWRNSDRERQLEIVPEADRVVLRLNLVDVETQFGTSLAYTLGLQLTPVKPHPQGWRMWRITPPAGTPGTCFNPFYTEGWALGTSYPVPKSEWEKIYTDATNKGLVSTIYLQPFSIWAGMPDFPDFGAEWRTRYCNPPPPFDTKAPPMSFMGVCPRPPSWGDYFVTTFCDLYQNKYKDMGWGAVYFDNTYTPACDNADHGCGYVDEFGVRQAEMRFLEHREVQRRFYMAMQERWPAKMLFNHESGQLNMMQLGFCHGMIDGEHLCLALPPDGFNYHKILPLDRMRAEFMGHNFGFVPIFLPEFTRASSGNAAVTNRLMENVEPPEVLHLVGLMFLHDILPWDAYSNPSPYYHLWAVEDAFGWGDDVEFLPYWKNRDWVTVVPADPNIVCSLYRRPGKLLAVVMNNTDADSDVTLQFDAAKLGITATSALDAWKATGYKGVNHKENPEKPGVFTSEPFTSTAIEERFPVAAGKLTVPVAKRNFRILSLP